MRERIHISRQARNGIVVMLALFFFFLCSWSVISTKSWIDKPFPGFLVLRNNLVAQVWLPEWEGFSRGLKVGDIISHATYGEIGELVEVEDRGEVTVKGLSRPVKIYRVEGLS